MILGGVLFALASITLKLTAEYLITPFWVINTVAAIYSLRFRHFINPYICATVFTFLAVFAAALWVDDYQSISTKALLSIHCSFQVVLFVFVYYRTIQHLRHFKYRRTLLLVLPTIISSFVAGLIFVFIPDNGVKFYIFLDYFLEQAATGLALVCIFYGLQEYRKIGWFDVSIGAMTIVAQNYIAAHPIFYSCFILPLSMVYFTIRYHFKRLVLLMGLISTVSLFLIAFPLAGQYWTEDKIQLLSHLSGYRIGSISFIIVFLLLSELQMHHRALYRHLERVSYYDELTGLKNRRYLHKKVFYSNDAQLTEGAVLLIDVDNFKKLNDEYGHAIGDLVLQRVAKLLSTHLLYENHHLLRWGGEEFLILLYDLTDGQRLIDISEMLIKAGNTTFEINGRSIACSFSMGVAKFSHFGQDNYHHLIDRSDRMLYVAKANGKQCFVMT